jgi:hypothetical protein
MTGLSAEPEYIKAYNKIVDWFCIISNHKNMMVYAYTPVGGKIHPSWEGGWQQLVTLVFDIKPFQLESII